MSKLHDLLLLLALLALPSRFSLAQNEKASTPNDITFQLHDPLEFKGRVVSGSLRQSEILALLDLPVRNGYSDPQEGYGAEMTKPSGEKFAVQTCHEWRQAIADQAYAASTFDMSMEGFLIRTCGLLFRLQKAQPPAKSYIAQPRITLADLRLLPAEMLSLESEENTKEKNKLHHRTLADVLPAARIRKAGDGSLTLTYGGFRQSFFEAARADFNGDGIEDLLVFTAGRAVGGTLGYSNYLLLTRTSPSGPLKLLPTTAPGNAKEVSE